MLFENVVLIQSGAKDPRHCR